LTTVAFSDARQFLIQTLVLEGELVVLDAEQVENRGLKIAHGEPGF